MSQSKSFVNTASILLIVSSVIGMAIGTTTNFFPVIADPKRPLFLWVGVILVIIHVLELIGVLGFWKSGASGSGWLAHIGIAIAIIGNFLMIFAEGALRYSWDFGNYLFSIAVPPAGLGFILLGIAVIRTNRWSGWHKLTPLVTGLYIPFVLLPAFALAQGPNFLAIAGWSCCRLALGIALAQSVQNQVVNSGGETLQGVIVK
jgi:hypothetical protein